MCLKKRKKLFGWRSGLFRKKVPFSYLLLMTAKAIENFDISYVIQEIP